MILKEVLLVVLILVTMTHAARILMVAVASESHLQSVYVIGKELVNRGQHEVTVLMPNLMENSPMLTSDKIEVITYEAGSELREFMTSPVSQKNMQKIALEGNIWQMFTMVKDLTTGVCTNFLQNEELFVKLREKKFDFAIIDGIPTGRCAMIMLYRLGIPYASVTTVLSPDMLTTMLNIPSIQAPLSFSSDMSETDNEFTFLWRLKNALVCFAVVFTESWTLNQNKYMSYAPDKPATTIEKLAQDSAIWLLDNGNLFDPAFPVMPHVFKVGGLSVTKPKPLTSKFKQIANSAENSLILIAFGGNLDYIGDEIYENIIKGLQPLRQYTFIWKIKQKPKGKLPPNVHLFDWVPQQDILGHKNTVLFITHCGNAGQYESLYNAVPMLGIPLFGDQHANAMRMAKRGYGKFLDLLKFKSPDQISRLIVDIMGNKTYKENIKRASDIYRLQKPSVERAADAVEQVLMYGTDHLRSPAIELKWYQLLMWDVGVFIIFVIKIVVLLTVWCCCKCRKCCCKSKPNSSKIAKNKKKN